MNYKIDKIKDYKQYDTRWAELPYRVKPACMRLNGCGATSIADIVCAIKTVTPKDTRKWLINNGYVSANQGTYWAGISAAMKHYGFKDVKNHATMTDLFKSMSKQKRAGIILFGSGSKGGRTYTKSGHFCAIKGYKYDKKTKKHYLYICDPGPRANDGWICYETEARGLCLQVWSGALPGAKKETVKKTEKKTVKKTEVKKTYKGFDISYVQNGLTESDFRTAKKAGWDFVIIRLGTVLKGSLYTDAQFENKYKNAKAAGMDIGVYFYSMAKTVKDAKKEAEYVVKQLENRKLTYPVFFDYEDPGIKPGNKKTGKQICEAFCAVIEKAGYEAGVYASYDWLTNRIDPIDKKYYVWLAQYPKATYKGRYEMHQYSSSGKVSGIGKNVDVNVSTIKPVTKPVKKKSNATKFLNKLKVTFEDMEQAGFKYSKSGCAYSWTKAKDKKISNCATYVCYTLQRMGLLPDTGYFYGSGGKIKYRGTLTAVDLGKIADVQYLNKAPQECDLQPGDICTYKGASHTQVYTGKDDAGNLLWYSYAASDIGKDMPRKRGNYNKKPIQHRIRLK